MSPDRFQHTVKSTAELESLIGSPSELVIRKQLSELDEHMCAFVARSPLLLLATLGSDGSCDVSPRGDAGAAAQVLDSRTLLIADRPGNRRADSLRNIIDTGHVGLLLLVPGIGETLRINGRACVTRDVDVLALLAIGGKRPLLAIGVEVEECYFQCGKSLIRSRLWNQTGDSTCRAEFDFAQVLVDQTGIAGQTAAALRQQIDTSYKERLY